MYRVDGPERNIALKVNSLSKRMVQKFKISYAMEFQWAYVLQRLSSFNIPSFISGVTFLWFSGPIFLLYTAIAQCYCRHTVRTLTANHLHSVRSVRSVRSSNFFNTTLWFFLSPTCPFPEILVTTFYCLGEWLCVTIGYSSRVKIWAEKASYGDKFR